MDRNTKEKQIADYVIKYQENNYRLAYSYVKNAEDALDIVQESIYKALIAAGSLKDPGNLKTWFYRIIVNTAVDFLRKRKRLVVADEDVLLSFDSGEVDTYPNIDLQNALDNLPIHYRSIIALRFFEDLKLEEIADVLELNANTVKTRLYRALEMLRLEMEIEDKEVNYERS